MNQGIMENRDLHFGNLINFETRQYMSRDTLYNKPWQQVPPFEFNQEVVMVFDDMIHRSVPGYNTIITRQAQLIQHFYQPQTLIYDLGCSHGNLGLSLCNQFPKMDFNMIAVDNSYPMLAAYTQRLADATGPYHDVHRNINLICADIGALRLSNASVVTINFTLQFLPISQRDRLIKEIYSALVPGGILLLSEKIYHCRPSIASLQKEFHHRFKRENGYSDLEISQKREALEDVLIPETIEDHANRMDRAGFNDRDIWYKWFNFCGWICFK